MLRPLPLRLSLTALALLGVVLGARLRAMPPAQPLVLVPPLPGDGALVLLPDGRSILIDGAADGAALSTWLGNSLPFGTRRIDALVLTRADATTLPGQLAALRRYQVGVAMLPPTEQHSSNIQAWQQLLEQQGSSIQNSVAGDGLALGACQLRVVAESAGRGALDLRCGDQHVYFLQSVDDQLAALLRDQDLPRAAAVVYPWQRSVDAWLGRMQPRALIFGEAGAETTMLTWGDRELPGARLLHEQLDGQIELALGAAGVQISTSQGD